MPNWGYSFVEQKYDADRLAKASGRDLRIKVSRKSYSA